MDNTKLAAQLIRVVESPTGFNMPPTYNTAIREAAERIEQQAAEISKHAEEETDLLSEIARLTELIEQQCTELLRLRERNNLLDAANGGDRELLELILRKVEGIKTDTYALTLRMRR